MFLTGFLLLNDHNKIAYKNKNDLGLRVEKDTVEYGTN